MEKHDNHVEARLRGEFGSLYPYLRPDIWEPAAVQADRIVAHALGWPDGRFISKDGALDLAHFELRGSSNNLPASDGSA